MNQNGAYPVSPASKQSQLNNKQCTQGEGAHPHSPSSKHTVKALYTEREG